MLLPVGGSFAFTAVGDRCIAALARWNAPRLEVAHGGRLANPDGRAQLLRRWLMYSSTNFARVILSTFVVSY